MFPDSSARRCQSRALGCHGVISRSEALSEGLGKRALHRKLESGEWIRLLPCVYALRGTPATFMRRVVAAYKWAGDQALMSHTTSARLLGLDGVGAAHVEVSTPRRLRSPRVIVHQRATDDIAARWIDGVRVAGPDQTLLDIASKLALDKLELALDSTLRLGLTRYDRIKRFLDATGGEGVPGSKALGELLRLREPCRRPHHSVLEVDFRQLERKHGLPSSVSQYPVELRSGLRIHIDFAYPDEKLAIEIDSVRWHSGVRAIRWDNERQNLLVALGWRVLRFEWNDVLYKPALVASQILEALFQRQIGFDL
jgi:REase_MTES_1575